MEESVCVGGGHKKMTITGLVIFSWIVVVFTVGFVVGVIIGERNERNSN